MQPSLPAYPPHARSLTGVVPDVLQALRSEGEGPLPPARGAIVAVIDGLGAANLAARAGHARYLSSLGGRRQVALSTFPSTTATALTGILTASDAGVHGLVGYRVRVPGTDDAPDQLQGWEKYGLDPWTWQRAEPVLAREAALGRPCFVVTKRKYVSTGFTAATTRGAEVHGVDDPRERGELAAALAARHDGALVYLYFPELDGLGHRHGWESRPWTEALEVVDDALRRMSAVLSPTTGALITADHGMIDVPAHRQILLSAGDDLVSGVEVIAGEPRMLHLHTEPAAAQAVAEAWRAREGARAWILTRDEAVRAGLFGEVAREVRDRIGDVLVAARASVAYYDDRLDDKRAQSMVGQHGSLTPAERVVPLLRAGAFG